MESNLAAINKQTFWSSTVKLQRRREKLTSERVLVKGHGGGDALVMFPGQFCSITIYKTDFSFLPASNTISATIISS